MQSATVNTRQSAWSAITELTERSVANRSRALEIPDFTRGRFRDWPPLAVPGA